MYQCQAMGNTWWHATIINLGFDKGDVDVDLKIVIQLINGTINEHHHLNKLVCDCTYIMRSLEKMMLKHMYCEAKWCADIVANTIVQAVQWLNITASVPSYVVIHLSNDIQASYILELCTTLKFIQECPFWTKQEANIPFVKHRHS